MTASQNWFIEQVNRFVKTQPESCLQIESAINQGNPALFQQLVIGAVDQEMLSVSEAAEKTGLASEEIMQRLQAFRKHDAPSEALIEVDSTRSAARLVGSGVCVWEVVREYRRIGKVEKMKEVFPDLSNAELHTALAYAEKNPHDIERDIVAYEAVVQRRRTEYPCS